MKYLAVIVSLVVPALFTGNGMHATSASHGRATAVPIAASLEVADAKETILLVTLEDGSVIMQTISSSADICFKYNTESSTTCLTRGEPVIDASTQQIIGFEMLEDRIDLVAK